MGSAEEIEAGRKLKRTDGDRYKQVENRRRGREETGQNKWMVAVQEEKNKGSWTMRHLNTYFNNGKGLISMSTSMGEHLKCKKTCFVVMKE